MFRATALFLACGAISTVRFEMTREGLQECEARILIEKALYDNALDAELTTRCQTLLDERQRCLRGAWFGAWNYYSGAALAGRPEQLFTLAAEVAAKRVAPARPQPK